MQSRGGDRLVGRAEARAALDRAWEVSQSVESTVAFVHGSAGYGKSSLVSDFIQRIAPPVLLSATGEPDESLLPFGVLAQLLSSHRGRLGDALDAAVRGQAISPLTVGTDLLEFLEATALEGLAIVVDDIQWADPRSVRALVFALRRLRLAPVTSVLACRREAIDELPASLRRLVHDMAITVPVEALDSAEIALLAEDRAGISLSRAALQRLTVHSDGSPLYACALLDELSVTDLENDLHRPLPAPRTYAEMVATHLDECGVAGRSLVQALAVVGDGIDGGVLARMAGVEGIGLATATDEAAAAGLIQLPIVDNKLRLAHPLIRSSIYHGLAATRAADLHGRAAEQLVETDQVASLRHRVTATTGRDSALASVVADQAAEDGRRGNWAAAAEGYRSAIRLSEPGQSTAVHHTLQMVECLALAGEFAAIRAAAAQLEPYPPTPLRNYCLGRLRALSGEISPARSLLASAWTMATDQPEVSVELRARIAGELARTAVMAGHGAEAEEWVQQAIALAPADVAARGDVMTVLLLALGIQGRAAEGLAWVAGLPLTITHPEPAELDGLIGRGLMSLWTTDLEQAQSDLSTALRATRRNGPVHLNLFAAAFLADTTYRSGDWDTTIREAETAAATARDLDNAWTLPMLHALAASPQAERGDFAAAATHVRAAAEVASQVGDIPSLLWAAIAAARLARSQRDAASVIAALEPLMALTHLDGVCEPGVQPWQPLYAEALISIGRLDEAADVLDDAWTLALNRQHSVQQLAVERTRAQLAAARGHLDEALEVMQRSSTLRGSITGRQFEVAQYDLVHGTLLRKAGQRNAAVSALRSADAGFAAVHSRPWLEDTQRELSRCGQRVRGSALPTESALTAHEVIVSRLVAGGLSNRDAATDLGVSVKTIEYHLGNIYAKLGVRTRLQLATQVNGMGDS